jgi:hypothetical protein
MIILIQRNSYLIMFQYRIKEIISHGLYILLICFTAIHYNSAIFSILQLYLLGVA